MLSVLAKIHRPNQVDAFREVPLGRQNCQRWVCHALKWSLLINDLVSYDFLFNGKLFKVFIDISSWDFSSDLADQFSNVFLGIYAFVFWILFKLVYFKVNFLLGFNDLRKAVHEFLHFLFFLGTGSHRHMDDPDGGDR